MATLTSALPLLALPAYKLYQLPLRPLPQVSIIIPTHNAGAYLRTAVESVLNERHECALELIVVDDRSTDDSLASLTPLACPELIVQSSDKPGAAAARNLGLKRATAPFVRFLDADDWLLPGTLSTQLAHLRGMLVHYPRAASVGWYESHDQTTGRARLIRQHQRSDGGASLLRRNAITGSVLHQRDNLLAVGGFDPALLRAQEFELHFRLALADVAFEEFPRPVFAQRIHPSPHRLSNQSYTAVGAEFWWGLTARQIDAARRRHPNGLPPALKRVLAYRCWELGRCFLREGDTATATRFFNRAREWDTRGIAGSLPYRIAARVFGPQKAEAFGRYIKCSTQ